MSNRAFELADLGVEVAPGGCNEPVLHIAVPIAFAIILLMPDDAH